MRSVHDGELYQIDDNWFSQSNFNSISFEDVDNKKKILLAQVTQITFVDEIK